MSDDLKPYSGALWQATIIMGHDGYYMSYIGSNHWQVFDPAGEKIILNGLKELEDYIVKAVPECFSDYTAKVMVDEEIVDAIFNVVKDKPVGLILELLAGVLGMCGHVASSQALGALARQDNDHDLCVNCGQYRRNCICG